MNPTYNLDLAKFLGEPPTGPQPEASVRGSCGRAYYAAFGVVRDALMAARIKLRHNDDDHRLIISILKQSADGDVAAAAGLLDQLRDTRNSADYEVGRVPVKGTPFTTKRSQTSVLLATSVIEEIERAVKRDKRLSIPPTVA